MARAETLVKQDSGHGYHLIVLQSAKDSLWCSTSTCTETSHGFIMILSWAARKVMMVQCTIFNLCIVVYSIVIITMLALKCVHLSICVEINSNIFLTLTLVYDHIYIISNKVKLKYFPKLLLQTIY